MVKPKWIILAVTTTVLLAACKHSTVDFSCNPPVFSSPPPKSEHLAINIYVDGTPSMEGYVNNDTKSRYNQTLDLLDSTFLLSNAKITYNRLGNDIQPITRDQFEKDTQLATFYNGRDPRYPKLQETAIDKAITTAKNNQLSVIITDLYQEDSDITKVSKEIKKNYLNAEKVKQGYAVGILAIKSEFNGTIYNEDVQKSNFDYNTKGQPSERYHPFYALFLGKYSDIEYFFTKMFKDGGQLVKDSNSIIFSPNYIFEKALQFPSSLDNNLPKAIDIKRPVSLQYKKILVEKKNAEPIDILEIGKKEHQEISLNYDVPFSPFNYTLPFDDSSIKTKLKIDSFNTFRQKLDKNNDRSLQQALQISKFSINENSKNISFLTTIDPKKMGSGIYFFTVDTIATDLQKQPWWEAWNSTDINKTDGSKTLNILKFLEQLKSLTTELMEEENREPVIGRFCYAIQKD
ncbi:hypothetical protein G7B40_029160 [Aetokthonos hydrillicola Thurmond2011]|jgi:hypothetical protein|uniref:VWFA domain-containing protein n=1 Tax=Aetokthonos hydrillicola Thurmond2011 TaxID=2712845 RepID=A0AAP5IBL7_9CYAN|nr:hypothetical protein [Aetokthonos hydrillicola]MBO3463176.1 hypothetical protein [Aetokthonos hydrillicola CCALA 1050]MBW4584195.1 hypothetical protein [Aetokthonos hydrillicola CCALA 1050]MDR9898597.1 hypothetical protein [Aetokthonos hydrillicola Thurmond2011]